MSGEEGGGWVECGAERVLLLENGTDFEGKFMLVRGERGLILGEAKNDLFQAVEGDFGARIVFGQGGERAV